MIANSLNDALNATLADRLEKRDQRQTVVDVMMAAFSQVRKKPVEDEASRLEKLKERIYLMSESVKLNFVNGRLVVKVAGSSEALMKELRFGTDWYDPWDKVDEILLAAILVDPEK